MATARQRLLIPDFLSIANLQSGINPHEDVVRAETEQWISGYDLSTDTQWNHVLTSDVPRLASRTVPYAGYQELRNCSDFYLLAFALDDIIDDEDKNKGSRTSNGLIHAMKSDSLHSSSSRDRMIKDFRARFFHSTGPTLQRRLLKDWEATFLTMPRELELRESKKVLSIEAYTLLRRENSALRMGFTHVEYALGLEIPDEVYENPVFNETYLAVLDMSWLTNDVHSYSKERAQGHGRWNYLSVVMNEMSIDLQAAADYSGIRFRELFDCFIDGKARLPSWGQPLDSDIATFFEGMIMWLAGNIQWSFEMPRYFGPRYEEVRRTHTVDLGVFEDRCNSTQICAPLLQSACPHR